MKIIDLLRHNKHFRQSLENARPRLRRMALAWCRDPVLADDPTQEALARALHNEQQLRSIEKFNAWIFTILSNCWREHLRRSRPTVEFDEEQHLDDGAPSLEKVQDMAVMIDRLRHEVSRLPELQRQTLTLVDLEEFSYAETAQILDIPIGTVMSRIHRAREKLCRAMSDLKQDQQTENEQTVYLRRVK